MNKLEKKQSSESFGSNLTGEQVEFIRCMKLASVMEITVGSEFDTPYVQTANDRWEFVRMGRTHQNIFNLDENSNKLLKVLCIKYSDGHMAPLGTPQFSTVKKIIRDIEDLSFTRCLKLLESYATSKSCMDYYNLKSVIKYLIRMGFPGFDIEDEEALSRIATPNTVNPFLRYQDVENTMPSHLKSLIVKRLVEFSTSEGLDSLSDVELKNLSVLALSYIAGPRPMQFSMLMGRSVKRVAYNAHTKLIRFQLSVPIAKQSKVVVESTKIALTEEVGVIVEEYKKRFDITDNDALYPYTKDNQLLNFLSSQLHRALNDALLFIQSDETKALIQENRQDRPTYSLYDFRHNIGHSMAMMNASAEEIAIVLGHTSLVAAQNYIMATPELSLLKHKSLGQNPVWKSMIGLLLTGYSVKEEAWDGHTVSGMLKGKLIKRIGGCNRHQTKCHLQKVRSCYGCFYFRPFKNLAKHQAVLEIVTNEFLDTVQVSSDSGDQNNPLIDTATQTKNEVEMVINRLNGGLR